MELALRDLHGVRPDIGESHEFAKVSAELDAAHTAWNRICQQLEAQLRRLRAAAGGQSLAQVRELARGLGALAWEQLEVSTAGDTVHSLEESQRRCENLSREMVRQAQKHEELVAAVAALQDTNRRLVEQIRFQGDELQAMAQQQAADERRKAHAQARQSQDFGAGQAEAARQLGAAKDMALRRSQRTRQQLGERLRQLRGSAQLQLQAASILHTEQSRLRQDATELQTEVKGMLQMFANRLLSHGHFHKGAGSKANVVQAIDSLAKLLQSEKEQRVLENLTSSHQHGCLSSKLGLLQAGQARDASQYLAQLQAWERSSETSVAPLARQYEDLSARHSQIQEDQAAMRAKHDQLAAQLKGTEAAAARLRAEAAELRGGAQRSAAALAGAKLSGQHLQQQIAQLHEALQASSKAQLAAQQQDAERHAAHLAALRLAELEAAKRRAEDWELKLRQDEKALQSLEEQLREAVGGCEAMAGEIFSLRKQQEELQEQRRGSEDALCVVRAHADRLICMLSSRNHGPTHGLWEERGMSRRSLVA
ncbi:unnamed protein product, partial [Effrenium voratum]